MGNRFAFNQPGFNAGETFAESLSFAPDQPYILQLRDITGVFLRKIEGYTSGSWRESVNASGSLDFTIPLDSDLAQTANFDYPNRIWIHDQFGRLLRQMVVVKTESDVNVGTYKVECAGLMYVLDQEFAPSAEFPSLETSFKDQVIAYLADQTNANPITLGFIHPSLANLAVIQGTTVDTTIYAALMGFWQRHGGVLTIDAQGRLNWDTDDVAGAKNIVTLYNDIETYTHVVDSGSVINRIIPKGKIFYDGVTHERRSVLGGIVEDLASQSTYGIRTKRVAFSASSVEELTELANKMLAYTKDPQVTRNISAIDLAKVQLDPDNPDTPHPEYIYPGARIKVQPPPNIPNDTSFSTMILTVDRSLSDFLGVKFTVGSVDPRTWRRQGSSSSSTAFFDMIANMRDDDEESTETSEQQDADIWDFLDGLVNDGVAPILGVAEDVKPVASLNSIGDQSTGVAATDHEHFGLIMVPFDSAHTSPADLKVDGEFPIGAAMGELGSAAGTDEGWWIYPANGSVEADWIPFPSYN